MLQSKPSHCCISQTVYLGITQDTSNPTTSWVYQAIKEVERFTVKLVISTTDLWTPTLDIAWLIIHLHTQHKEASHSLLHSPLGYAFPSSIFQGVQRRKPAPLDLFVRFLPTLGLSSQFRHNSTPNRFRPRKNMHTQQTTMSTNQNRLPLTL